MTAPRYVDCDPRSVEIHQLAEELGAIVLQVLDPDSSPIECVRRGCRRNAVGAHVIYRQLVPSCEEPEHIHAAYTIACRLRAQGGAA